MSQGYEMYSVGKRVNNYAMSVLWQMVSRLIVVIIFKCIEISDDYVVEQELT